MTTDKPEPPFGFNRFAQNFTGGQPEEEVGMSFSQEVREELSRHTEAARHCNIAELAAILGMAGEITANGNVFGVRLRTENITVARKCFTLLRKTFNISCDVSVHIHRGDKKSGRIYTVRVRGQEDAKQVLQALKFPSPEEAADSILLQQYCCRRAFLRGAFLSAGSISNPEKAYHFEIVCACGERAGQLQTLIRSFGPDAKIVQRKKHFIVYIKEGAQIVDMLNIMGAHVSLMNLENIRIVREVRNSVNRQVNCEAANINKTVYAAVRQMEDIRYLEAVKGLDSLPDGLAEVAKLRLANPDASLKELGGMLVPPVGKSGVNHRLRKLCRLAGEVRQSTESHTG